MDLVRVALQSPRDFWKIPWMTVWETCEAKVTSLKVCVSCKHSEGGDNTGAHRRVSPHHTTQWLWFIGDELRRCVCKLRVDPSSHHENRITSVYLVQENNTLLWTERTYVLHIKEYMGRWGKQNFSFNRNPPKRETKTSRQRNTWTALAPVTQWLVCLFCARSCLRKTQQGSSDFLGSYSKRYLVIAKRISYTKCIQ